MLMALMFSDSFIIGGVRDARDGPHDLGASDCKHIKGHLSIINMLVTHAAQKEPAL